MQKFLSFIIIILIVYSIANKHFRHLYSNDISCNCQHVEDQAIATSDAPLLEGSVIDKFAAQLINNILKTEEGKLLLTNMLQNSKGKMPNATSYSREQYVTLGPMDGDEVSCGHIVEIQYSLKTQEGVLIEQNERTLKLGFQEVIPELENAIVGMRVGQTRYIKIPGRNPLNITKGEVTVKSISNHISNAKQVIKAQDLRVFDSDLSDNQLKPTYLCGAKVNCKLKIYPLKKSKIGLEQPPQIITFNLGDNNYPLLFSHVLFNKPLAAKRIVVTETEYLRNYQHFTLPADVQDSELILLEFSECY